MAFTPVLVTADYDLPDGLDPTGTVSFTPTEPMINGTTVIAAPVTGMLDVDGKLSITLAATDDTATTTASGKPAMYLIEESISGATRRGYAALSHASSPVDLSTLDRLVLNAPLLAAAKTAINETSVVAQWAALLAGKQPLATLLSRLATAPVTVTYAASLTVNAALGSVFRVAATGDLTLTDITNGVDGQTVTLEVLASGANRVLTIGADASTIPSGTRWFGSFHYNAGVTTWILG